MDFTLDDALARLERYRDTLRIANPSDSYDVGISDGLQIAVSMLRRVQVSDAYRMEREAREVFG